MFTMTTSNTVQNGVITALVCLVVLNLFTLHYIINQTTVHDSTPQLHQTASRAVAVEQSLSEDQKIPRIVHLSWKNDKIPGDTVKWVKRWKETNPQWQVWFWTDVSAKDFIAKKYPEMLGVFNNYRTSIFRADAMRYIILYEYGGVWADLDVEPLKSLEPVRDQYSCIMSQESEVHARVGWHRAVMVCNAFMATRKSHPFLKFIIGMLEINQKVNHPVAATGPVMLTKMHYAYQALYETLGTSEPRNKVHIATVNMFLPTVDVLAINSLRKKCKKKEIGRENQYMCDKYLSPSFKNGPTDESFTDHHWWHSWLGKKDFRNYQSIQAVLPNVTFPDKSGKF